MLRRCAITFEVGVRKFYEPHAAPTVKSRKFYSCIASAYVSLRVELLQFRVVAFSRTGSTNPGQTMKKALIPIPLNVSLRASMTCHTRCRHSCRMLWFRIAGHNKQCPLCSTTCTVQYSKYFKVAASWLHAVEEDAV